MQGKPALTGEEQAYGIIAAPMPNVLIIAYEFPPSAGGGVQRITKFARYLPQSGWVPTVLCAEPVWGRPTDPTLLDEVPGVRVVRLPARNTAAAIARAIAPVKAAQTALRGSHAGREHGSEISVGKLGPPSVPLSARIVERYWIDAAELWARAVPAAARELQRQIGFDVILGSGPPPSALVAAGRAAAVCGAPYVADFRDAWTTNPSFRRPGRPRLDTRSVSDERTVIRQAAAITTVSQPIADEVTALGAADVTVLPNGFDPTELPRYDPAPGPLRIAFMGRFYGATDPGPFFDGAAIAIRDDPECADLCIDIVGQASDRVRKAVESRGLRAHVVLHGFLPHVEALTVISAADVGLVVLSDLPGSEAVYTGKLFEYLGMGLPVLLVGPVDGVGARLVHESGGGTVVPYGDAAAVARALGELARAKEQEGALRSPDSNVVGRFDRREQAAVLAGVLDRVADRRGDATVGHPEPAPV